MVKHKATGTLADQMRERVNAAHLGCNVRQVTPLREGPLLLCFLQHEHGRETKVGYFERARCVEQEVLCIEIAVSDAMLVDVVLQ